MSTQLFDLNGKVAIFVGGGGGLGRTISLGLARAGANVIPVSRNKERNREVVEEIVALGRKSLLTSVDVTDEQDVKRLVDEVMAKFGHIDILINAAGKNYKKPALELTGEEWDDVLAVNLKGTFLACKAVGEKMIAQKSGKIINIASLGSHLGITRSAAYCASKGAVLQLTKVLAAEWAPYGINVNCISPGYFKTPLTEKMLSVKETYDKIVNRTPMQRLGLPEDLVGATIFLCSDASNFVTGSTIAVDGGFLSLAI
ncbi:gluconate 5-dehydrogenase [Desulforamulus putei DSM 12395]|uniref:Gluconate 5-dehydrogenase n=1 Tax=Desulforamulus putei DSM 12395 TaxID=1121429 RepID=A0A1M5C0E2_9FIRM|nr:glucose 1-dehydrogenase [Desulforamulus putei]SHF47912.1 gluconate 5-dehydrogenase [Desulforamulus putei DSM 12395]